MHREFSFSENQQCRSLMHVLCQKKKTIKRLIDATYYTARPVDLQDHG